MYYYSLHEVRCTVMYMYMYVFHVLHHVLCTVQVIISDVTQRLVQSFIVL